MVPGSAKVFAAVGLPVNTIVLNFETVTWKPTFVAGHPVMAVAGAIRNTTKHPVDTPPVRISLMDKQGRPLTRNPLADRRVREALSERLDAAWVVAGDALRTADRVALDTDGLEDHEPGAACRKTPDIHQVPIGGKAVLGGILVHGRHHHPIAQRQRANLQWRKEQRQIGRAHV